jgi:alpha-tubulin suppressor-like RCC1 family protein
VPLKPPHAVIDPSAFFTAIKADGSIKVWGNSAHGETSAPSTGVYTKVYSNAFAFAALKADGSITAWGDSNRGGNLSVATTRGCCTSIT